MANRQVTTFALLQERERTKLSNIGLRNLIPVGRMLRMETLKAYRQARELRFTEILDKLEDLLLDAMVASHLQGRLRSIQTAGVGLTIQHKALSANPYGKATQFMQDRLKLDPKDIVELRQKYGDTAINVTRGLGAEAEARAHVATARVVGEGMHVRQGIQELRKEFDAIGLSPKHPWLMETLVRTQIQVAYGAGRWNANQDPDIAEIIKGYEYVTVGDDRVRPTHAALEGTKLPSNDPMWGSIWPPNGFNCRCTTIEIFDEDFEYKPPSDQKEIDGVMVRPGPDVGWAMNPGMVHQDAMGRLKPQIIPKLMPKSIISTTARTAALLKNPAVDKEVKRFYQTQVAADPTLEHLAIVDTKTGGKIYSATGDEIKGRFTKIGPLLEHGKPVTYIRNRTELISFAGEDFWTLTAWSSFNRMELILKNGSRHTLMKPAGWGKMAREKGWSGVGVEARYNEITNELLRKCAWSSEKVVLEATKRTAKEFGLIFRVSPAKMKLKPARPLRIPKERAPKIPIRLKPATTLREAEQNFAQITGLPQSAIRYADSSSFGKRLVSEKAQQWKLNTAAQEHARLKELYPNLRTPYKAFHVTDIDRGWANMGFASNPAMTIHNPWTKDQITGAITHSRHTGRPYGSAYFDYKKGYIPTPDEVGRNCYRHELAHTLTTRMVAQDFQDSLETALIRLKKGGQSRKWLSDNISEYAVSDKKLHPYLKIRPEAAAETFALYTNPRYIKGILPKELEEWAVRTLGGAKKGVK